MLQADLLYLGCGFCILNYQRNWFGGKSARYLWLSGTRTEVQVRQESTEIRWAMRIDPLAS